MRRFRSDFLAAALIVLGLSLGAAYTSAQQAENEVLEVPVGSVFEMQIVLPNPYSASWILTKNRELVTQSKDKIFQTRITQVGEYTLTVEAKTFDQSTLVRREFKVMARQRQLQDNTLPSENGSLVRFDPAPGENNRIILEPEKQVLSLTPLRRDTQLLAIDLNTAIDSNGDSNEKNDDDTSKTLFRSEKTPLHLWFAAGGKQRGMRIGALFTNGKTFFQEFTVETKGVSGGPQVIQPPEEEPRSQVSSDGAAFYSPRQQDRSDERTSEPIRKEGTHIIWNEFKDGVITFSLQTDGIPDSAPLLRHWEFGDGEQSLLDRPVHRYGRDGRHDVTVTIKDLQTGEKLAMIEETVTVLRRADPTTVTDPKDTGGNGSASSEKPAKEKDDEGGGSWIGLIVKILLVLIVTGGLGAGGVMLFSKLSKKSGFSLEKTLENAEKNIVGEKSATEIVEDAAPMEIVADGAAPPVDSPETAAPAAETVTAPVEKETVIPPVEAPIEAPVETPPPVEATVEAPATEVPPVEQPAPAEAPTPTEAPTSEEPTDGPAWLQQGLSAAEKAESGTPPVETSPVVETPASVEAPAENVAHDAMVPSAEQLEVKEENAPSWLQQGITEAKKEGQTPTAPSPLDEPVNAVEKTPEQDEASAPAPTGDTTVDPNEQAKQEWLREKKREKRRRYRDNVKKRKENGADQNGGTDEAPKPKVEPADDEPVAFVKAEDVAPPKEEPAPPTEKPKTPDEPHTEGKEAA